MEARTAVLQARAQPLRPGMLWGYKVAMGASRKTLLHTLARVARGVLLAVLVLLLLYRFVNPPFTTLMLAYWLTGKTVKQEWVSIDEISPHLVRAVITAEDGRFCQHWGVDWTEVENALERAEQTGRGPRGASTIPMQTVKNLFLWQSRSYVRKVIEVPLAYAASFFWPKRRMIEIYLNIAEWGPGIFGAQAAARHHFRTTAARLSRAQAARLAAALPNPHVRNAGRPGPRTRVLSGRIRARAQRAGAPLDCIYTE